MTPELKTAIATVAATTTMDRLLDDYMLQVHIYNEAKKNDSISGMLGAWDGQNQAEKVIGRAFIGLWKAAKEGDNNGS